MFSKESVPAVVFTQPPRQSVSETLFPRLKWPGCAAEHLSPSGAEVKMCEVIPVLPIAASWRTYGDSFSFTLSCVLIRLLSSFMSSVTLLYFCQETK
jgi:hypothetical protein